MKNRKKNKMINSPNKDCTLFVDGMHCASCEVLIEKKLLKKDGIESVDASLKDNKVNVVYSKNFDIEEINEEFKDQGYKFSYSKFKKEKELPLLSFKDGSLYYNPKRLKSFLGVLGIVCLLLILFFSLEKSGLSGLISVSSSSTLPTFFLFGLLAGASSCAALIGGLLLSLSKQWNEVYIAEDSAIKKLQPFIMFNTGRLISFLILGGVLGAFGSALGFSFENGSTTFTSILIIVISFMMVILGLQMFGVSWASKLQFRLPKLVSRLAASEENVGGKYMPFVSGLLTFFLPCGFTLVAQGIALTSGSFLNGSLIMFFFALGTLPMLALISISSFKFSQKPSLNLSFNKIAGILVLFFALYNINSQLNVLGLWSLNDINFNSEVSQENFVVGGSLFPDAEENDSGTPYLENNSEVQTLSLIAKGFNYTPTGSTTLQAGKKTILEVDNQGIVGCGSYLAARGLFNNYLALKPGKNTIEFTPKKGTYKITCTMGMVAPVTIKVV